MDQFGAGKPPPGGPPSKPHQMGTTDVKPRLTKEQHDILESHFQQQHKPSTSTKKGFAETLNVPVDKINNWFQNRRAKVKQDLKKQINQMHMQMGVYPQAQMPMVNSQVPQHFEQQQQPPVQDYYHPMPMGADISPTSLPVQSVEGPSALDLSSQLSLHQQFDMQQNGMLRSIPEANQAAMYNPNAVMQSFMAATAGASYMQNSAASLPQEPGFSYHINGLPNSFQGDLAFSVPSTLPNEAAPANDMLGSYPDFSSLDYSAITATTSGSADVQNSTGSLSSEASPFSGAQSTATTQSSGGPNGSSVTSIASAYTGWTEEQNAGADMKPANPLEDSFDGPYNMPQASASEQTLPFWSTQGHGHPFSQADMYQHANASAHAILSSPGQSERKLSTAQSELEAPSAFADDAFSRRNSSTTNLANTIEAIHIQSHTPDGFKQPNQPSTIAARRHKRPTALNASTLRSASYSNGMPSPQNNGDHTLRRIRSSGIPNAAGRVQKPNPGSAQRSPMTLTFADAANSPKFARTFSSSSVSTLGQGGSLAPPTPLTPNEMGRFPYWQSNTVIRTHPAMPEHSSPESLNVAWSADTQSAGLHSSAGSPPSTPLDPGQVNQGRYANETLYRDTPPQSAPATQQTFPRSSFMPPPHMRAGFHSTTDLTIAQPKPEHFRRPSLPDAGHAPMDESQLQFPMQFGGDLSYEGHFKDMSLEGIHHNVPFAPSVSMMPDFLVHEYHPSNGMGPVAMMRRTTEPPAKSYIFANQGPRDFKS